MSEREREMPVFETKTRIDWQEYWRMYLRLLRKSWIIWVIPLGGPKWHIVSETHEATLSRCSSDHPT